MRILKTVLVVLASRCSAADARQTQPNDALDQVVDRIISQEQAEMNSLKPYTPLVETYIQNLQGGQGPWGCSGRRQVFHRPRGSRQGCRSRTPDGRRAIAAEASRRRCLAASATCSRSRWSICRAVSCR